MSNSLKDLFKVLKHVKDLKGITKKTVGKLISIENVGEDYYVMKIETDKELKWNSGEHAIFTLPDNKNLNKKDNRIFSVASAPKEGIMILGFRTKGNPSPFKKELINMKKDDKITIQGPFGWFKVKDNTSPMVLFASGVGVTPIRGLLKELENDTSRPIEVIYASESYYLFEDEINSIVKNNPKINLYKYTDKDGSQAKLKELASKYENNAYYYISGAPVVIDSLERLLKSNNIKGKLIIADTITGY